jgi:hypothetical protein
MDSHILAHAALVAATEAPTQIVFWPGSQGLPWAQALEPHRLTAKKIEEESRIFEKTKDHRIKNSAKRNEPSP